MQRPGLDAVTNTANNATKGVLEAEEGSWTRGTRPRRHRSGRGRPSDRRFRNRSNIGEDFTEDFSNRAEILGSGLRLRGEKPERPGCHLGYDATEAGEHAAEVVHRSPHLDCPRRDDADFGVNMSAKKPGRDFWTGRQALLDDTRWEHPADVGWVNPDVIDRGEGVTNALESTSPSRRRSSRFTGEGANDIVSDAGDATADLEVARVGEVLQSRRSATRSP